MAGELQLITLKMLFKRVPASRFVLSEYIKVEIVHKNGIIVYSMVSLFYVRFTMKIRR